MKNVLRAFGIIALLAAIGFSMAACDGNSGGGGGGTGGVSFAGTTWKCTESLPVVGSVTYTLTFTTASRVKLEALGMTYNGTYTVTGSSVTVKWDAGYTGSGSYSVNGNKLTDSDGHIFIKQQ
jgi:hypothetical protein